MSAAADWAAVRRLFDELAGLAPAEREAALAAAGLDAAVVAEVRSLLVHLDAADEGTLAAGAAAAWVQGLDAPGDRPDDRRGQRLGPWRIVSRLGAGGMGDVWLALRDDGAYRGEAAIKVLRRGMDSAAVLARFAQEQQALARLAHPHIARLLDAGRTADGLPYFVMERVAGQPIDQACRGLPLAARLGLFLQLADAVAHAHRNLLVHRDLKPSNVLVDGEGRVKLLDFGIAKALDPLEGAADVAALTHAGERPYTPHYASPEQVRGEPVSTATDIYSLGVLLFVMLTGQRPYGRRATTPADAVRSVLEEEPSRPSGLLPPQADGRPLRRQLEGDLDNILLKALEKPAERRYASVDAFAADLRAFLGGYPVSARPAGALYVAGKFFLRHRWAVLAAGVGAIGLATALAATVLQGRLAAALGVVALAAGLVMALVQARQAQRARDEAAAARDDARAQLERVKRITSDLVFRYGDTVTLLPGGLKAQEAMLKDSVAMLEPALAGAPDDLDLAATMASALGRLAEILGNTMIAAPERAGDARAVAARALALAERAWPQRRGDWRFVSWHLRTLIVQSQLLRGEGRLEEAAGVLRRAAERAEAGLARQPGDAEARMYLATGAANAQLHLAQVHEHGNLPSLGQPADALAAYRSAERLLREQLAQKDVIARLDAEAVPGDPSTEAYLVHQIGTIVGGRALVQMRQENFQEAWAEIEQAVALRRRNIEHEPRNVAWRDGLMTECSTAALILLRLGRGAEALEHSTLAWATAAELAREEGPSSRWAGIQVRALLAAQHGRALVACGRAAEGLEVLDIGLAHWRSQAEAAPQDANAARRWAWHRLQRAVALQALGRGDEARAEATEAAARLEPLVADAVVGRDARQALAESQALLSALGATGG